MKNTLILVPLLAITALDLMSPANATSKTVLISKAIIFFMRLFKCKTKYWIKITRIVCK